MSRLTPVEPSAAPADIKAIYDGPLAGKHFNLFKSLANSAAALNAYLAMSGALGKGAFNAQERELIQLAVAQANNCGYCLAAHTAIARGHHVSDERILEARRGRGSDGRPHALIQFVLALHEKRGLVSDADIAAFLNAGWTEAHLAEVVPNYALAIFTNYFNHLNQTPIDFPQAPAI